MQQSNYKPDNGVMLNAYPDSIGESLKDVLQFLSEPDLKDVFSSFYILPSLFNYDLDHGFSIIDYELNELYATSDDIQKLKDLGLSLKLDFVLNHLSVLSPQFQDILTNGDKSEYFDFFINWNSFWAGHGSMTESGYIQPHEHLIKNMFFRKPGLPLLMVRLPDGTELPYWNTFYQEVRYEHVGAIELACELEIQYASAERLADIVNKALIDGKEPSDISFDGFEKYAVSVTRYLQSRRKYLGQMDLNVNSPKVWEFYSDTISRLSEYGVSIIRLDAFAYASKKVGARNFLNEPETFELLSQIKTIADRHNVILLPEIHSTYEEKVHEKLADEGYMVYDFFLPGLIIDALERKSLSRVISWANELVQKKIRAVNMLGCHDGIPLLDLQGLIPQKDIELLIKTVLDRGGIVKNLHGKKNMYYQVNATYYSALGADERKMLLARAIQLFMPGKPQIWYLDLFLGENNHEAVRLAGESGHREINRTRLSTSDVSRGLANDVVRKQLKMLRFRNTFPAFGFSAEFTIEASSDYEVMFCWRQHGYCAVLRADLSDNSFKIEGFSPENEVVFSL